jgi:hypothetical protein
MKRALLGLGLILVPMTALAGKAERDYQTKTMQPAVKAAEAKFKAACGCALTITVADSLKSRDELAQATNTAHSITDKVEKYCADDGSKKAMCQLKSFEISLGKETKFTFKDGKGTCTTDGKSSVHWDMITREIDK